MTCVLRKNTQCSLLTPSCDSSSYIVVEMTNKITIMTSDSKSYIATETTKNSCYDIYTLKKYSLIYFQSECGHLSGYF